VRLLIDSFVVVVRMLLVVLYSDYPICSPCGYIVWLFQVTHTFWSTRGFLSNTAANKLWNSGAVDLAGSGPVHMTGGVAALVGGIIVGPRIGRFHDKDGNLLAEPASIKPHSVPLMFLGTFALWFGWYGFNPGSVLVINTADKAGVVALVAANTTLCTKQKLLPFLMFTCAITQFSFEFFAQQPHVPERCPPCSQAPF
jgi:ammonia channel protein AmtB